MSDRLNIRNEMRQLDLKQRDFYRSLTDEEKKKFSNFLMIRWSATVKGDRGLQEYYVQSCNHYLNKHFKRQVFISFMDFLFVFSKIYTHLNSYHSNFFLHDMDLIYIFYRN